MRFVRADHGLAEYGRLQRVVDGREHFGQRVDLVPQRLRVDLQALAAKRPSEPLQRSMIAVLPDCDADRDVDRIATTHHQLQGPRRRLHAPAAAAPVLLSLVMQAHEAALVHVDFARFLKLTFPLRQLAPARGAHAVGGVQLVDLLHNGKLLLTWPMAWVLGLRRGLVLGVLGRRAPLRRIAEKCAVAGRKLRFEFGNLQLELLGLLTLRLGQRVFELQVELDEPIVFECE